MRRGLHRTGLSRQTQDTVDSRTPDPEALGELFVGLSVLRAGFNDANPKVGRDGCGHAPGKAQGHLRASCLDRESWGPWMRSPDQHAMYSL